MRYDTDHKQKSHERILREAAKAVRAEGPAQVGVAAVMSKAQLTHGAFYAHFASKDALIAASIGQMFEEGVARWERETRGLTPARGLAAYIDCYLSVWHRDRRAEGCPMAALASDIPRLPTEAQRAFAAGVKRLTAAIGECVSEMGFAQPDATARSIVNELVGAISLARCEPDRKQVRPMLMASRSQLKARLGLG